MELRHLKMISEVAECKSLTRAADRLFLSQSALSHQLKEVEQYFKTQIFIRQKKQMLLTKEGELILESGRKILDQMEQTKKCIDKMREKDAGEIRFSSECYTSYHWLSEILKDFYTEYPKVEVKIEMEATRNALPYLLDNKIDVGIFEDNTNNKIVYTQLFTDEFFVIVPKDHRWAHMKWIEPEQLNNESYIMYDIPTEKSTIYKLIFKDHYPPKVYQLPLTEVILEMVKAGIGFAILPNWIAGNSVKNGDVAAVKITRKGIKRTWYAGVLKDKNIPIYTKQFIGKLSKYIKKNEDFKLLRVA
jgi:LysR family transcriptional regulator for metE and metH